MCVLFIAKNVAGQYPLIIIANRDEFYQRPTAPLCQWPNSPIVAGQDLEAGGTWLGITKSGRFSALTNIRDPSLNRDNMLSRGELVTSYLTHLGTNQAFQTQLSQTANNYNGYNLVFGDHKKIYVFNNATAQFETVDSGIHGLSNAALNSPWPKVEWGKERLAAYLHNNEKIDASELANLLQDRTPALDKQLPETGVAIEIERVLSPLFIHHREMNYGTRCTSVLLFSANGEIEFTEISYDNLGQISDRITL